MLLRDQYGITFADIGKEFSIPSAKVSYLYNRLKIKQINLYINHIAFKLGHETPCQMRKFYIDVYDCYKDRQYACAYLEKEYKDILTEYRDGEPGMPAKFIKRMPQFKEKLSERTVSRIIKMREAEKASFVLIAKKLRITQAKARHAYNWFYHKKVMEMVKNLQDKAESNEEKTAIWNYYFKTFKSSKSRYDMLKKDFENFRPKK